MTASPEIQPEFQPESGLIVACQRDLKLAMRSRGELAQALIFFVIVVSLFPIAIGPEAVILKRVAPGVLWVCALLAVLLTLPRIFQQDYLDGTLEQLALSRYPLAVIVGGKMLAHWLTTGLPLALLAPAIGLQYGLEARELVVLTIGLLLGTPVLTMLGAMGAALTLGVRGGAMLMALLVLPLYIPVLIFGTGAVESTMAGLDAAANLYLLAALNLFGIVTIPFAVAHAIKISLD
jgi:heme exporter protein B